MNLNLYSNYYKTLALTRIMASNKLDKFFILVFTVLYHFKHKI